MPKEHWLRKNKKAFSSRKAKLDTKLRTQGDVTTSEPQAATRPDHRRQFAEVPKVYRYTVLLLLIGVIVFIVGQFLLGMQAYTASKTLVLKSIAEEERALSWADKQQAIMVLRASGFDLLDQKDYQAAREDFERLLQLAPDDPEGRRGWVWSRVLLCETRNKDCREVHELLSAYLQGFPDQELEQHLTKLDRQQTPK